MSDDLSESKISDIMAMLGNDLRLSILKLVYLAPRSFSDLLNHLSLESTGKLTFHLGKMSPLVVKRENDGLYELSELGIKAYSLIDRFESKDYMYSSITNDQGERKNSDAKLLKYQSIISKRNFSYLFFLLSFISALLTLVVPYFLSLFIPQLLYTIWIFPFLYQFFLLSLSYKIKIGLSDTFKSNLISLTFYWSIFLFIGTLGYYNIPSEALVVMSVAILFHLLIFLTLFVALTYFEIHWSSMIHNKFITFRFVIGLACITTSILIYLSLVMIDQSNFFYLPFSLLFATFIPAGFAYLTFSLIHFQKGTFLSLLKYIVIIGEIIFIDFLFPRFVTLLLCLGLFLIFIELDEIGKNYVTEKTVFLNNSTLIESLKLVVIIIGYISTFVILFYYVTHFIEWKLI